MSRSLAGLLQGRTLCDRYAIDELIGRGGMSLVYRARDLRLHRPVAVKIISLPSESEVEHLQLRERLRREAAAAARVPPHPNVVQVYDYGTDEALDLDFIAMELLDGRDLKSVLREGAPVYDEGIRILLEAARGLSAGHRVGIVHRDVKPANMILTEGTSPGTVKLLDFGIAKALETAIEEDLTRTGQVPHSPAYASPEQRRSGEVVGPASDVYQLGLVAYEVLAGRRWTPPSNRNNGPDGEPWSAVPEPVRAVVEAALRSDPAARYPDAAAFAEALSRASERREDTAFLNRPATPDEDAGTLHDPGARKEPVGARAAISPHPGPIPPSPPRRRGGRIVLVILILLLAAGVIRALGVIGAGDRPADALPLAPDIEALDEEFRDLIVEAHENLQEQAEEP